MKLKHYLKAIKLYFFLSIIIAIGIFVITFLGLRGTLEATRYYYYGATSEIEYGLLIASQIFASLQHCLKILIIALIGYCTVTNFKTIYGKLKGLIDQGSTRHE